MKMEMRWYKYYIPSTGNTVLTYSECKKLQYKYQYDPPDSPYPQKHWTDWIDVPTIEESEQEK